MLRFGCLKLFCVTTIFTSIFVVKELGSNGEKLLLLLLLQLRTAHWLQQSHTNQPKPKTHQTEIPLNA